ncbi:MAG: response regulator [Cyclobacteriaceae bacterium]
MKETFKLLDFIVEKIYPDELAENYFRLVNRFKDADKTVGNTSGLNLYLLGEQQLIRQKQLANVDKLAFRKTTFSKFTDLPGNKYFALALLDFAQQRKSLSAIFLQNLYTQLADKEIITGDRMEGDDRIEEHLGSLQPDVLTARSRQLYEKSKDSLGEEKTAHIFHQIYNDLYSSSRLLEGFSQVLCMIPEEIRTVEQIEFSEANAVKYTLRENADRLESENKRLSKEIEEVHQIEEELKESESLLNKIIESALDAMVLLNEKGEIDYWSAQSERLTGKQKSDIFGKKFSERLLPDEYRDTFDEHVEKFVKGDESLEGKKRFETKLKIHDSQEIDVEISMTSVKLKERFILSAFIRDISQRKDYEREILDARDKAEEASAAKLTFLSMMSHEIRTPLNAVIGTSQLLLAENPRKDQLENLNILKFSAENLLSIINDILDFNKAEEGKMVLESQPFNLELLCNNIVNSFTPLAKEKGISISFKNKLKRINLVSGDETRLSQVLINLFGNAVKFTSEGSVMLSAELINLNDRIGEVKFEIIDTGIGITKDKIGSIFDRFTQVHEYNKEEKYGGTGLGLPIAKNIVGLMGGDLMLNSIPRVGSTFYFSIKLPIPFKEGLQTQNASKGEFDIITNKKILIVEDHKINQIVASKFLKKYQCTIDIAENGEEAVNLIESGQSEYDLILMDLEMPKMNGYDAAIAIRKLEEGSEETPIVALSANALLDVSKKVLEAGMNGYISKPFEAQHFYAQIADNIKD